MRRIVATLVTLVALAALAGCGKSTKSVTPVDSSGSQAAMHQAELALGAGDYAAANTYYKDALAKDPGNRQAAAGAAFTELFLAQDDPSVVDLRNRLGPWLPPLPITTESARVRRVTSRFGLRSPATFGLSALASAAGRILVNATADPPLASEVQNVIRAVLLPRLAYAESRFATIESDPSFVYLLPPAVTGLVDTLEIDIGDVLLADGAVQQLHAVLEVLVAYNWDARAGAPVDSLFETPGSQWATLHADGASRLASAKAHLLSAAGRYGDGIESIGNETDDQSNDLIPEGAIGTPSAIAQAQQELQRFTNALNSAVYVTFTNPAAQPDSERVNVGRFFVPAVTDLKTLVPAHTFDALTHDIVWSQPITFPDPTFNGILPDATNTRLRFLWGL